MILTKKSIFVSSLFLILLSFSAFGAKRDCSSALRSDPTYAMAIKKMDSPLKEEFKKFESTLKWNAKLSNGLAEELSKRNRQPIDIFILRAAQSMRIAVETTKHLAESASTPKFKGLKYSSLPHLIFGYASTLSGSKKDVRAFLKENSKYITGARLNSESDDALPRPQRQLSRNVELSIPLDRMSDVEEIASIKDELSSMGLNIFKATVKRKRFSIVEKTGDTFLQVELNGDPLVLLKAIAQENVEWASISP